MKRILSIQDLSCVGKCSLTVALPVISAMGVECAVMPTAVLSTHTVFAGFTCHDLAPQMQPMADHWCTQNIKFDGIYSGYLANTQQIALVCQLFQQLKSEETLIFVDPAMADNGKLYTGFDPDFPQHMKKVCHMADVMVPNLTEACLLTDTVYTDEYDEYFILELLKKLAIFNCETTAITGVSLTENTLGIVGKNQKTGEIFSHFPPRAPGHYHGTGDLFAACTVGGLMQGKTVEQAMATAAQFVALAIEKTPSAAPWYGVSFEKALGFLTQNVQ